MNGIGRPSQFWQGRTAAPSDCLWFRRWTLPDFWPCVRQTWFIADWIITRSIGSGAEPPAVKRGPLYFIGATFHRHGFTIWLKTRCAGGIAHTVSKEK